MKCESCQQQPARVHVFELQDPAPGDPAPSGPIERVRHLCEGCARELKLPVMPSKKNPLDIWKLLQQSGLKQRREAQLTCPDCGMTLAEFREKGRLGCPKDYEVFAKELDPLLERIHNAKQHRARVTGPKTAAKTAEPPRVGELEQRLRRAIQAEDYELAAELRDRLRELSGEQPPGQS